MPEETDHTLEGGFRRVQRHLTEAEEAEYLKSGKYRVRIIKFVSPPTPHLVCAWIKSVSVLTRNLTSVWRPLLDKIEDAPLAICDPNSVAAEDLLEVDRVTEHWVGEVYFVKHNVNQRWYWLKHMRADEVCIFTSFDSHPSPGAMKCEPVPDPNLTKGTR
jgi:hypothetical protein